MAADTEVSGEGTVLEMGPSSPKTAISIDEKNIAKCVNSNSRESGKNDATDGGDSKSELEIKKIVDLLQKLELNPLAKEFFPSYYYQSQNGFDKNSGNDGFPDHQNGFDKHSGNDGFPNYQRRRNNYIQGKKRMNARSFRAQREDNIRRTVYVSDIDHNITEEQLAALFSVYGQVVDCRVCGDSHSHLRFAFVEFSDEYSARASLCLNGTHLGFSSVKVLPSKTAILPVNPTFLPRSEDEREMCARTVYCTNIDKKVSQTDVKSFFEARCGEVSRLRLLGDQLHSTRIAFVEFFMIVTRIFFLDKFYMACTPYILTCGWDWPDLNEQCTSRRMSISPCSRRLRYLNQ